VHEKQKQLGDSFEPKVSVSTQSISASGGTTPQAEIRIRDNGGGMPQKVLDKIFQPFFTTKPTGEGTGLGLSLSYDIVTKMHSGNLDVETRDGEGTEFIIRLPI
jgi:signal transduction histidine kinase